MSIAEFSSAMKNKAIKEWFNTEKMARDSTKQQNVNVLVNPTSMYRSQEQTADKTAFLLTKDTVRELIVQLKGVSPDDPQLEKLVDTKFAEFKAKDAGTKVNRRVIDVGNGQKAVYFPNIGFDSITNLVNSIMDLSSGELAKEFEKGHVVGLNTELLRVTANRIGAIDGRGSSGEGASTTLAKNTILTQLEKVINYYKTLDYESANMQPAEDIKVYASVDKSITSKGETKYLVELQAKANNQRSADEVKATIGSIRKLFDPGALTEKKMSELIDSLIPKVSSKQFQEDLVQMKSSPSFGEMIMNHIANVLVGKPTETVSFNHKDVEIASIKAPKYDLRMLQKLVKEDIEKLEALKAKLNKKAPALRQTSGQFYSLANLQDLINARLMPQIAANMGTGFNTNILNLRTGRFAASAEVVKMTQSKEGMITAFYTYMKYPYQTFEPGYRQGYPASRDPKLLISKSIKEIAITKVSNKMRAVLI